MLTSKWSHVYVATHRVDFRKSWDGLLAECYGMGLDPYGGDAVMFVSGCRTRLKLLCADGSGLLLLAKRFNSKSLKTNYRFLQDPGHSSISHGELMLFFEGSKYRIEKKL